MLKTYKTSQKNRTNYIYFTADGGKVIICPGENGVTEADIELLHSMDDAGVDSQRRHEYKIEAHFEAYHDGEDKPIDDKNQYLSDESLSPEHILNEIEDEEEKVELIKRLGESMEYLDQKDINLIQEKFVENKTNVAIAASWGVSETAIRKRLKKIIKNLYQMINKD